MLVALFVVVRLALLFFVAGCCMLRFDVICCCGCVCLLLSLYDVAVVVVSCHLF